MDLRRLLARFILVTLLACATRASVGEPIVPEATAQPSTKSLRFSEGMARFVGTLEDTQKRPALFDFDDAERLDLRLAPLGLEGLRIDEMTSEQWAELRSLLGNLLSPAGLAKLDTIRSLESEVAELEGGLFGFFFDRIRQVGRYFLTLYGTPSNNAAWGGRFDGHHFSLNWTSVPNAPLSATPLFLGGQPRVVPAPLPRAGLRVLSEEEDRAVALLAALSAEELERARIPFVAGSGIRRPMSIAGAVPLIPADRPGLARRDLGAEERLRFDALVEVHLENYRPAIAERYREQLLHEQADTRIIFAAKAEPLAGSPLYYRIRGGDFLIEYDNTSTEADHIHVVLRDIASDFGLDALAEHRAAHHD